jgi:hypothetical protein
LAEELALSFTLALLELCRGGGDALLDDAFAALEREVEGSPPTVTERASNEPHRRRILDELLQRRSRRRRLIVSRRPQRTAGVERAIRTTASSASVSPFMSYSGGHHRARRRCRCECCAHGGGSGQGLRQRLR